MVPADGFDYSAARESYKEAVDLSASVRDELSKMAALFAMNYHGDMKNAHASLMLSYVGLLFVLVGFGLQIAGQF